MIIYWYFFIMAVLSLLFAIIFIASLRVSISSLRLAIRTVYNIGIALMVVSLLTLISAIVLELILT